jgi:hypothetical protein
VFAGPAGCNQAVDNSEENQDKEATNMQTEGAMFKTIVGVGVVIFRICVYASQYPLQSSTEIIMVNVIPLIVGIWLLQALSSRTSKIVCGGFIVALIAVLTGLELQSSGRENEKLQALQASREAGRADYLQEQKRIEQIKANLRSDDYSVRREAVVELLKEAKTDNWQDHYSRPRPGHAGEILKEDPQAAEALIAVLKNDKDNSLRQDAAIALGIIFGSVDSSPRTSKNPRAVDALLMALKEDPDRGVRGSALKALEEIKDPRGLEIAEKSETAREERRAQEWESRREKERERALPFLCKCIISQRSPLTGEVTERVFFKKKVASDEECRQLCPGNRYDSR